ncbi:anti-sigma factor family protein [Neorhizobium galegae]|uniref:Putative transmembrane anti-sigma factor n=1 Tax=Neorhizobium galegae bv. officinalis TaxID=323656 RepID=A0A0T7GK50_NEOGA|nr:anti-sigma factor [Neorhizobium galegae]CDZ47587.1 Putative transmembrane anti-sigma factor [Neorhizobium galegae bv. officinalis]
MTEARSVTEAELHAYADGFLDEADRTRVQDFLAENPDAAQMVADWQEQNDELRAAFAGHERSKPTDIQLLTGGLARTNTRPSRRFALAAAAVVIFAAGALGGHYGPLLFERPDIQLAATEVLPREARNAFLVYASEVRHPVEVFANEETHLANWLGKRLSIANLKVPNLQGQGFKLVGGRLLPVGGKPGALFMYEDQTGQRLTVLVGRNKENRTTSFRFASASTVETFYWIDGELGYAVTGEISRDMLRRVAEECYRQFPS